MSAEENKAIVRRIVGEWNKGNPAVWFDFAAPDCVVHQGSGISSSFEEMKPTGKRFTIPSVEIYRFAGGKIAEVWEARDTATMMQQLGVAPPQA